MKEGDEPTTDSILANEKKKNLRLQVIIMCTQRHLNQRILKVRFASFLLFQPYFVETLATDAAAEMGVELFLK